MIPHCDTGEDVEVGYNDGDIIGLRRIDHSSCILSGQLAVLKL